VFRITNTTTAALRINGQTIMPRQSVVCPSLSHDLYCLQDQRAIKIHLLDQSRFPTPKPLSLPVRSEFNLASLIKRKRIRLLLPPGMGDIHWIATKIESLKKKLGIREVVGDVWDNDGRPRGMDFLRRVPFITPGEYFHRGIGAPEAPTHPQTQALFNAGLINALGPLPNHDAAIVFNGSLEKGKSMTTEILPFFDVNWDYEVTVREEELDYAKQYGRYVLCYFSNHGMFPHWTRHLSVSSIRSMIDAVTRKLKCSVILTGSSWDRPFNQTLGQGRHILNLTGETDTGQLFGLIKGAHAFIGFCGGNTMMSVHFKTPTVILWSKRFFPHQGFRTNWCRPDSVGNYYMPVNVEDGVPVSDILRFIGR
jgi:hypothetical protein